MREIEPWRRYAIAALLLVALTDACTTQAQAPGGLREAIHASAARSPWCNRLRACTGYLDAIADAFEGAGRDHDLDPWLLAAMAHVESRFRPTAVGRGGELSVMQLHPRWFRNLEMQRSRG